MCKCIRYWERDEGTQSPHNMSPITCDEYVKALKMLLNAWLSSTGGGTSELEKATREVLGDGHG